jgi:RHS repeat-associated protein
VTTLGSGVDGAVRRIETAYDGQGNPYLVTSYDAATGGSVVNQVRRAYNGLGQLTTEWQAHSGTVNTSTTPAVGYTYSEMPSGANHSRLTAVTYPSGYTVNSTYASGLDASISRLSALTDTTGTLESYSYLGLGTVVVRSHPQPDLDLTYVKRTGESAGDAGDQYTGLDRFGRVVDQRWVDGSSGTATDQFQYGYDRAGDRTYRDNLVNGAFGEVYTYDGLGQIASFTRGTLNGTKTGVTGSPARTQTWDYDAVGNWDGVDVDGVTQSRTANAQNEVTSVGSLTTPSYDADGNMTQAEPGLRYVYDAWNRMVAVKNSAGTTTLETFGYDGLNRRVTVTAGGATTDLYYSDSWQVLEERVGGAATQRYVWSPVYVDALVLRDRDTDANGSLDERLWVQQDANWNVTAVVDGSGAVVERYDYDPFGAATVYSPMYGTVRSSSSYGWQYEYQGLRYDPTSGLYEARERWLSPTLGRFTSLDPTEYGAGDVNLYRWEGNDPTNKIDPLGLQERSALGRAIDAVNLPGAVWDWWWSPSESESRRPIQPRARDITDAQTRDQLPAAGTNGMSTVGDHRATVSNNVMRIGGTVIVIGGIVVFSQLTDRGLGRLVQLTPSRVAPARAAACETVVNHLVNYQAKRFQVGSHMFQLDRAGMTHILTRHHPDFWDGSVKATQSFLNRSMTTRDIENAITVVISQNRDLILRNGTRGAYQIRGQIDGVTFVVGFNEGRIGQFYAVAP